MVTTTSSGYRGAPKSSTRNSRVSTPTSRSATPSAFQKAVAAATRPALSAAIESKPIVTRSTPSGSPPVGRDDGVEDRVVGGQPGDSDGLALELARARDRL